MVSNNISHHILANYKKDNYALTGRATTGLYLILKALEIKDKQIICPANICYSIVNAITFSGNKPVFVDVHSGDGNTRIKYVQEKTSGKTRAILVPHMFGNPCVDIRKIRDFCDRKKILLIEDCALSIGGTFEGQSLGQFGDYTLFSFGHNKTIDIGTGGLIASNQSLEKMKALNAQLPAFSKTIDDKTALYSKLYRDIYYSDYYQPLLSRFSVFNDFFEDIYLFKAVRGTSGKLVKQFENLSKQLHRKKKHAQYFENNIHFGEGMARYPYQDGAIFWRYNLLLSNAIRKKKIINKLLEHKILISAWYPPINHLFGDKCVYKNAENFAKKILNLSLNENLNIIKLTTKIINEA